MLVRSSNVLDWDRMSSASLFVHRMDALIVQHYFLLLKEINEYIMRNIWTYLNFMVLQIMIVLV